MFPYTGNKTVIKIIMIPCGFTITQSKAKFNPELAMYYIFVNYDKDYVNIFMLTALTKIHAKSTAFEQIEDMVCCS